MGKYREDCYKKVCEKCVNALSKKLIGGYECRLGKKPSQNKCFYFTCQGIPGKEKCATCVDLMSNKGKFK